VSLSPAELADRALATFIVVTQILIARYFIRERRWAFVAALTPLWLVVAIDVGMSFTGSSYTAPFLPAPVRSAFSAIGFVWGMASALSFAIYRLWRVFSVRILAVKVSPAHSPERRALIRAVGVAAAAAPFVITGFGAVIERTSFKVTESLHNHGVYLAGTEDLVVPGTANLLLSHNPDVFPVAIRKGFDAMHAGHTHGGQVTVEILNQTLNFARFATPYVSGLYRLDGRSCYVTKGIGTIAMPVRIGAPPEITLARLVIA